MSLVSLLRATFQGLRDDERTQGTLEVGEQLSSKRNVRWLWTGELISQLGDGLNRPAILWFVYDLTGSAVKMTFIGVLQTIPPLVLGPVIGVYLDRLSADWKLRVMISLDLARGALLAWLATLSILGMLTLPTLYTFVFLIALAAMPYGPALNSTIPSLVQASRLTAANAAIQSTATLGLLCGPAISGATVAFLGVGYVLYANAATFLLAAFCKMPIRVNSEAPSPSRSGTSSGWINELAAGFRLVFVEQRIIFRVALLGALFTLASTGFIFLLPIITKNILSGGPMFLGVIWSALGLGMIFMSVLLMSSARRTLIDHLLLISAGPVIEGLAIVGLAAVDSLVAALGLVIVIGAGTALVMPMITAFIQATAPQETRARALTIFGTITMVSAMAGMTAFSWAADHLGSRIALVVLGVVQMMAGVIGVMFTQSSEFQTNLASRSDDHPSSKSDTGIT